MKRIERDVMGETQIIFAEKIKNLLWFHVNGQTYCYQKPSRSYKAAPKLEDNLGTVTPPMSGKIIQVFCEKGDPVQVGQPLIVMEAMKMEYTLEAKLAGKVLDVKVSVGEHVTTSNVLVEVESL